MLVLTNRSRVGLGQLCGEPLDQRKFTTNGPTDLVDVIFDGRNISVSAAILQGDDVVFPVVHNAVSFGTIFVKKKD